MTKHNLHFIRGEVYGGFSLLEDCHGIYKDGKPIRVKAQCNHCGTVKEQKIEYLRTYRPQSCGCLNPRGRTHGMSQTPTFRSWLTMKARCDNPNTAHYNYYGGRGVTYDKRWNDFTIFLSEMGERPSPQHQLDKDIKGGVGCLLYNKDNCTWALPSEHSKHKRSPSHALTESQKQELQRLWNGGYSLRYIHSLTGHDRRTIKRNIQMN